MMIDGKIDFLSVRAVAMAIVPLYIRHSQVVMNHRINRHRNQRIFWLWASDFMGAGKAEIGFWEPSAKISRPAVSVMMTYTRSIMVLLNIAGEVSLPNLLSMASRPSDNIILVFWSNCLYSLPKLTDTTFMFNSGLA